MLVSSFKSVRWIVCLVLALQPASAATSQTIPVSNEYVLRAWEMDDGLPSNTISGIAQTPDGYLWIATPVGMTRFDGVRFTSFLSVSPPAVELDEIGPEIRDRNTWLGFSPGGAARRNEDGLETQVPLLPRTPPPAWLKSLESVPGNAVWYDWGDGRPVTRWLDGQVFEFKGAIRTGPDGEAVVLTDSSGQMWNALGNGSNGRVEYRFQAIAAEGGSRVSLAPVRDGGMWAVRGDKLARHHAGKGWVDVADLAPLGGGAAVNMLLEDPEGAVWLATRGAGLVRWKDGTLIRVETSHNNVLSLAVDREGNLWAGTLGGGLDQLRPRRFYLHKAEEGLLNDNVVSICEDAQGGLWLAPSFYPPMRALGAGNRVFTSQPGWESEPFRRFVTSMCPAPDGSVWFTCSNGAMRRWQNGMFTTESLWEPAVSSLLDRTGTLWVATMHGGLVRHRDGVDRYISQENGLTRARALAEDGKGRIWVGTEDGLVFQRTNDRFVPVPLPGAKAGEPIRFIVADGEDAVWIGALGGGLYRWRAGKTGKLPQDAGLPVADLRSLLMESSGDCWFGTGKGLFRLPRRDLEAAVDGGIRAMHVTAYGRRDGLPSTEFELGFRNAATRTKDGRLWFATYRGALEVIPQDTRESITPLNLMIEEIRADGVVIAPGERDGFILPPRTGPLQIHFTLPNLSLPERLRFRHRLVGLGNNEWVSAGSERTATFPHLPPGEYQFEVTAAEGNGPWLPTTAALGFSVAAAWWETGWFRFGEVILGALLLVWAVRYYVKRRMKRRLRKLMQENALERERTRIARDIHDELGANLTQIAITSKLAKLDPPELVSAHIDEIAAAARNTVESLDEIVWAVNPRHDTLPSLIEYLGKFAANFLAASGIDFKLVKPAVLPPRPLPSNVRHHLFLVVKEALNNAVKYAGAKTLTLEAAISENLLRVVVADDGCGFEPGTAQADANGLRNMNERMAEAGGTCRIESHPGKGTRVTFELPLKDS
jgi:signal transduction histidine kinase/ligand-binding sensor domain-containing protein